MRMQKERGREVMTINQGSENISFLTSRADILTAVML